MSDQYNQGQLKAIKRWLGAGSINIFGRPFAGKDTQGRILADLFDAQLLGGGDILRNSVVPERSKYALKLGHLIPIEEYVAIVLPYLSQEQLKNTPLILSSVGRWHGEEPSVMTAAQKSGHPLKVVYYLDLSEETVWGRWQKSQSDKSKGERGHREDDSADILRVRLQEFRDKTEAVIEYYRQAGLLRVVDAEQPAPEVTAQILDDLLARIGDADR